MIPDLGVKEVLGMMKSGLITNAAAEEMLLGKRFEFSLDQMLMLVNCARAQAVEEYVRASNCRSK